MKKVLSLIIVAFLFGITANAQDSSVSFGVKGGVNLSNFGGDVKNNKAKVGFLGGITLDYAISPELYVMTGLEFVTKGAKEEYSVTQSAGLDSNDNTYNPMYLQLPVHLGYKLAVTDGVKIVFHAGPYVAYGIGGKIKENETVAGIALPTEESDFFGKDAAKELDYGIGGGVGAEFGKIAVGLGYDFGLADIDRADNTKLKTQSAYLTLGYKF